MILGFLRSLFLGLTLLCLAEKGLLAHGPETVYWAKPVGKSVGREMSLIGYDERVSEEDDIHASTPPVYYRRLSVTGAACHLEYKTTIFVSGSTTTFLKTHTDVDGDAYWDYDEGTFLAYLIYAKERVSVEYLSPSEAPPSPEQGCAMLPFGASGSTVEVNYGSVGGIVESTTVGRAETACQSHYIDQDFVASGSWAASKDSRVWTLSDPDTEAAARERADAKAAALEQLPGTELSSDWTLRTGRNWTEQKTTIRGISPECESGKYTLRYKLEIYDHATQQTSTRIEPASGKKLEVEIKNCELSEPITLPFEKGKRFTLIPLIAGTQKYLELTPVPDCGCSNSPGNIGRGGGGRGGRGGLASASISGPQYNGQGGFGLGAGLGSDAQGNAGGSLSLGIQTINSSSYSPQALFIGTPLGSASSPSTELYSDSQGFKQSVTADRVVERIDVAHGYELKFYPRSGTTLEGATMPYTITGTPLETLRVTNPDAGAANNRIRFERISGGNASTTIITQDVPNKTWTLVEGGGLRTTTWVSVIDSITGNRIETKTVKGPDNVAVAVEANEYKTFAWGESLIRTTRDPQGENKWEEYAWQTNSPSAGNYGQVLQSTRWDGFVTYYTYTEYGQVRATYREASGDIFDFYPNGNNVDLDGDGVAESYGLRTKQPENNLTYTVALSKPVKVAGIECKESWIVTALTDDSWSSTNHMRVIERSVVSGAHKGSVIWRLNGNGTLRLTTFSAGIGGQFIEMVDEGAPNGTLDAVVSGTRTVTTLSPQGYEEESETRDIATNAVLASWEVITRDAFGRPTQILNLDGFTETRSYSPCCGLLTSVVTPQGTTTYEYDALKRRTLETVNGVSTRTIYDAADQVTKIERIGTNSAVQVLAEYTYDLAGRRTSEKDASGRIVTIDEELISSRIHTTRTYPDAATAITIHNRDGSLYETAGTASRPVQQYEYSSWGEWRLYTSYWNGWSYSYEWTNDLRDMAGRQRERTRSGASGIEKWDYNTAGQLTRHIDPDGVRTLYGYNAEGELSVTALDLDRDDVIDDGVGGADRVTYTTRTVANKAGVTVHRTTTEVLETDGSATRTVVSISEVSADGLQSWQTAYGQTTHQATVYGTPVGTWTETTTYPDNSTLVRAYTGGRLATETRKDSASVTLTTTSYAYDVFGRLSSQTQSGLGTTSYTYHADDQIHTVTTPDPDTTRSGVGYDAQVTTYLYNNRGWLSEVTHPDATQTFTTYWPTGKVKRTWGSRAYPSEYAYDPQGRLKTLTTWQDFAGTTGEAVTTWNYNTYTGRLENKRYQDNQGPDYTYTDAGRLLTRTWARGLVTTYAYGNGGDLTGIDYSDATPDVTQTYDRVGRLKTTTDAAGLLTRAYDSGRLDDETYTGSGILTGLGVTRGLDSLKRPASLGATGGYALTYDYDQASRLATVTQGSLSAVHAYKTAVGTLQSVTIMQSGAQKAKNLRLTDKLGRVYQAYAYAGTTLATRRDYTYNSANQRTRVEHEDTRRWDYGYDALGQVISADKRLSTGAALPGYAFAFDYDDIGNRTQTTTNGRTATYTPDLLNRYTQRQVPGAVDVRGTADPTVTVLVDDELATRTGADFHRAVPLDNSTDPVETTLTVQAVKTTPPPGVATENRPASLAATPESYTYDTDGNLTQDGRWDYTWDGENRLVALELRADVALASGQPARKYLFAYDGQSRRIRKQSFTWSGSAWTPVTETKYLYDGWNLLAEYNGFASNALVRSHAWGLDLSGSAQGAGGVGGLLWTKTATQTYAAGYDANGNIIAWIDTATGTLAGTRDYGAFGEAVVVTGVASSLPFGFSTKYLDVESDLYYYGFRYYNPSTGRWLSRDPIEENGGLNLYGYVGNNPINWIDYLGLKIVYKGPHADRYRKLIECLKKNGSQQIKDLIKELEDSKRDHRIDELDGENADGTPTTVPYTTPDMLDTGEGHDTSTYINPSPYTLGNRTWTFPQAFVHELLHARDQLNDRYDSSDPHTSDFMRMERSFTGDAAKCKCE